MKRVSLGGCHVSWTFKNEVVDQVASWLFLGNKEPFPLHFLSTLIVPLIAISALLSSFLCISFFSYGLLEDWRFSRLWTCLAQFYICICVLCSAHVSHLLNVCWVKSNWTWALPVIVSKQLLNCLME